MKKNTLLITLLIVAVLFGYLYGLLSYKFGLFPVPLIRFVKEFTLDDSVDTFAFADTTDKKQVSCSMPPDETAVLLVIGQSNSANHGETRHTAGEGVYNFSWLDGRCYRASDPLLGATGRRGSVWTVSAICCLPGTDTAGS